MPTVNAGFRMPAAPTAVLKAPAASVSTRPLESCTTPIGAQPLEPFTPRFWRAIGVPTGPVTYWIVVPSALGMPNAAPLAVVLAPARFWPIASKTTGFFRVPLRIAPSRGCPE